jgi:pimeloyl-ACP methyl ester carboxylesterase
VHLVQGVTTGGTVLDGKEEPFDTVPEARTILVDAIARVSPAASGEDLRTAIQTGDANDLPPEARPLFELITNEDPRRVKALVNDLPARYREFLTRFSPSGGIGGIEIPVFVLQARNDEATPWTEAIYLERHIEGARVLFLEHFSHVDPPSLGGILLDAPDAWRFVSWILAAQE